MIFRFLLLSDEADNFKREIKIDSEATFAELQTIILQSVNYQEGELASFFICDDNWEKELEITSIEMDTDSDVDSYIMAETVLNDILEDEKQKLMYTFDFLTERSFFMELREIITGKYIDAPTCSISQGTPPPQFIDFEQAGTKATTYETEENFYGDESYNIDELDIDGFDGLDDSSANNQDLY